MIPVLAFWSCLHRVANSLNARVCLPVDSYILGQLHNIQYMVLADITQLVYYSFLTMPIDFNEMVFRCIQNVVDAAQGFGKRSKHIAFTCLFPSKLPLYLKRVQQMGGLVYIFQKLFDSFFLARVIVIQFFSWPNLVAMVVG